jgi:hypothetical protein
VAAVFGGLLFIVVAHTTLETVRDATFLVHVGSGGLGFMYLVTAALTLAVGAISSSLGARSACAGRSTDTKSTLSS